MTPPGCREIITALPPAAPVKSDRNPPRVRHTGKWPGSQRGRCFAGRYGSVNRHWEEGACVVNPAPEEPSRSVMAVIEASQSAKEIAARFRVQTDRALTMPEIHRHV